jgi:hypothetical protein
VTVKERSTTGRGGDTASDLVVERRVSAVTLDEEPARSPGSDDLLAAATNRVMGFIRDVLVAVESVHGLRGWGEALVAFRQRRDATTQAPSRLTSPEDDLRTSP